MAGNDVIDCKNHELAGFLDKVLTIQLPDVTNETTDIGIVSTRQWLMAMLITTHTMFKVYYNIYIIYVCAFVIKWSTNPS